MTLRNDESIAVIGLGYVGLPVALAFGKLFQTVFGFDIDSTRIKELKNGIDCTGEITPEQFKGSKTFFTSNLKDIRSSSIIIICVPTPINEQKKPDLSFVIDATILASRIILRNTIVVYESTVYPGVTEDICGPILEKESGLQCGVDFHLGYSPERINPGDTVHTFESIIKVVSASNEYSLKRLSSIYSSVVTAGVYEAKSIRVAEAAKAIENTQRDLNIAFMNELALLFDRASICTKDVLDAAATKWNFLNFEPGLVGGHCIGVDPYYLTTLADNLGFSANLILAGRGVNEWTPRYISQKLVKQLCKQGKNPLTSKVALLGFTFKENISDIRNSKSYDLFQELDDYGVPTSVVDPLASSRQVREHFSISLSSLSSLQELDALILAVPHNSFINLGTKHLCSLLKENGILFDIRSRLDRSEIPTSIHYWSL